MTNFRNRKNEYAVDLVHHGTSLLFYIRASLSTIFLGLFAFGLPDVRTMCLQVTVLRRLASPGFVGASPGFGVRWFAGVGQSSSEF